MKKASGVAIGKAVWVFVGLAFFTAVIAGVVKEEKEERDGNHGVASKR